MLLAKMWLSQILKWVPWLRDPQQESSAQWKGPEDVLIVRKASSTPYWEDSKPPALLEPAPLSSPWQPPNDGA